MRSHILLTTNTFFSTPQCHPKAITKTITTSLPHTNHNPSSPPPSLAFLNKSCTNFNLHAAQGVRFDGPIMGMDMTDLEETEDSDLVVETCITTTLPPALTLDYGLLSIKEAVDNLKLNPPSSTSGIFRFQVAVPPSAKALKWFCCQPESSRVFPLFFLSTETENPPYESLHFKETRGVFGIGAAIYFTHSSSSAMGEQRLIKRYLSNHSNLMTTYGFVDVDFNAELSSMKLEAGSYYFFIPQIELDECGDVSLLAATLAWSDTSFCTFEQAIHSFESSHNQATSHFWLTTERWQVKFIRSTLKKLNVVEDETVLMVYMNAPSLDGKDFSAEPMQLKEAQSSRQFCVRLSPTVAFSLNMLDHASEMSYSVQDCPNINAVWAWLIIEECSRLGLMYFCIAPGSRSSPLAIAASSHPITKCIACFDERSLAFHAVGFARGSHKPAVVITSSGTAVSNLLPAVVEASQDFVPLLLLTADRPPELHDTGANQTINQVNHFGSFVRFFFSLPTPTDLIPARMVLTTLDSAVHRATSSPNGPVHINCPFGEPLDNSKRKWMSSCLKGLDRWMPSSDPFTKYIQVQHSLACHDTGGQMAEVLKVIQGAKKGLLFLGAIHTEDEMWAVLLLAKHLLWPVVADILSGLRLRKLLSSSPETDQNLLFVDHLDHALLSDSVKGWLQVDVIIQIGSRITSKRISQMVEECFPFSYIVVDKHPCRHDPSHIVTHRIQSTIIQFTDRLLKAKFTPMSRKWNGYLQAFNMMVKKEIFFQIRTECSLTEPHVAHVISAALSSKSALFIGNSMAIRDADVYGYNWENCIQSTKDRMLNLDLPCQWIPVAGNRGASGIDGLLSSASGFAVGCSKQVFCVIGDVSFLHDTNGLAILSQRTLRKPMTIIVINNHGGAIFSLLPIADRTEPSVLNQYFYTSHNISLRKLCVAHGVKHLQVKTKLELQDAIFKSHQEETDCVIEVESSINANATFHSTVKKFACQAADHAVNLLSRLSPSESIFGFCEIHSMDFSVYKIQLCAPPTSSSVDHDHTKFYREGFILSLSLEDGSVGLGEVAPLQIHRENLLDVEEQLRFLLHLIKGAKLSYCLPLLRGSFSAWIWNHLGIPTSSIFPSVRCGLEMAILNAIAVRQGSDLLDILAPQTEREKELSERSPSVQICALIDSKGTPAEVAYIAGSLVEEGFAAIKLKVARGADPIQDAAVIQEVRKRVGYQIGLRVDANRNWTYDEAIQFGAFVKNFDLQYIEEPVQNEDDIVKYCEESGLPVALDETIDNIQEDPFNTLVKYTHPRIVAVVIKPSVVGGFENAALIARWAQLQGKMAVVSAAFESGLGLSSYIMFSSYLEMQNTDICKVMNRELEPPIAHGLGTYRWLKEDVTTATLGICLNPCSGFVEASITDATRLLQKFQINHDVICKTFTEEHVCRYQLQLDSKGFSCFFEVQEIGQDNDDEILVFLHGFLGASEDWIPIMKGISRSARCISIDLPGHGRSRLNYDGEEASHKPKFSIEIVGEMLYKLIEQITPRKVTLVGYSMGARIALYIALRFRDKIKGAVLISGSPGLKDELARKIRRVRDDSLAGSLISHGLQLFIDSWYTGELWQSLRSHPHFHKIVTCRSVHDDVHGLAKALSDLSIGRQLSLWGDLRHCSTPVLLIVGEKDRKFKAIAEEMFYELNRGEENKGDLRPKLHEMVKIPDCGHAAHLENPLPIIRAVRQFLSRMQEIPVPEQKAF